MGAARWAAIAAAVLAAAAVWALSVEVSLEGPPGRAEVVCGSATDWSEEMRSVFAGGAAPGQGSQTLVSEEAHQRIEACRDVRDRQTLVGTFSGGAAVLCAGFAIFLHRRALPQRTRRPLS
ncbi:hypothetical protein ACIQUM_19345 [Amycolatopsis azurea]|uniref:hypothetical protein n=1 Tax=Amycolatopsis azurea TaxID=36819 RepID=UPI00380C0F30